MAKVKITAADPGDKKPTKVAVKKAERDAIADEMRVLYNRPLKYDNKPTDEVVKSAAKISGVDPAMLFTSSFQEGMNQAIVHPDDVSEAYENANKTGGLKGFPVDGFYGYGLDTFGQKLDRLKKYLPPGFENEYRVYDAENEQKSKIKTAAFKNNHSALIAKSAMLRDISDTVDAMATKRGVKLDDKAKQYFTMAAYNGGEGNARMMLDEYVQAKDKNDFIDNGRTSRGGVHKNISPRLKRMQLSNELLGTLPKEHVLSASAGIKP